uniref:Uncharacterized protein n=1 Tax=Chaetoceros debilis TaxID=122233 RepID=A0A7S3PWD2_9STRA|mmetsp:Transcript_10717/g.16263  ORF Transcript_10717/g.16263 Transcript_10717/m.16263 type:complete len:194 (-) Transcript_10717:158-739(-)|eukprot:CAMPEP_0194073098 /NCGR_PEP_ID=MMETSP0149-20130528/641_1 /TAXON_ID=122233 /ORGANISM="Chaetoceros debilis, Strain MM31A-1" /LENGTH=193 /DNA_ID=CAMNT_0038753061 /DNA_START=83 /DNA_END=664 /DNA_ORIENTATION=-
MIGKLRRDSSCLTDESTLGSSTIEPEETFDSISSQSSPAFERLYHCAESKRVAGKELRMKIERKIAAKHEVTEFPQKIPLQNAQDYYHRAKEQAIKLDKKLEAMAVASHRPYKARYNFMDAIERDDQEAPRSGSECTRDSLDIVEKKIPLSHAGDFYYKSVKRAIEKDERLASIALEKDTSFKATYNFRDGDR